MTADQYLTQIINKYRVYEAGVKAHVNQLYPTIQNWGNQYLLEAIYSGSIAKGTAISLSTDADVFLSLSSTTQETLAVIYETLFNALMQAGYHPRKQFSLSALILVRTSI